MKTSPSQRAWENDPFWKEIVSVITSGKKLRPDHYLEKLSAEDLDQLRSALSFSGTLAEQQQLCPKRIGGPKDGMLPGISTLSEIAAAVRQVQMLRGLERLQLVQAATKERGQQIGLDPRITDTVCKIVAEETMAQEAQGIVGNFAINAAHVLMQREGGLTKAQLKQIDQQLAREKYLDSKKSDQEKALEFCLDEAKGFPDVLAKFKEAFAALKKAKAAK